MKFWQAVAFLETDQLLDLARACEEAGFHGATVSDHIFYPRELRARYPYSADGNPIWAPETPWPDPWVLIAALSATTARLHFTTNAYIAPARDLFTVAKLVSTAAVLSGGRVALGLAAGWCRDEFEGTGQDFGTRGKRLDEMIPALRALWSGDWAEFHGAHYDFDPVKISPVPREAIPIYAGGDTPPALRRAARLGDGWMGNAYTPGDAEAKLAELRRALKEAGRDGSFEIILALLAPPGLDLFKRFEDLGVTGMICAPWMVADVTDKRYGSPLEAKIAATHQFGESVIARMS